MAQKQREEGERGGRGSRAWTVTLGEMGRLREVLRRVTRSELCFQRVSLVSTRKIDFRGKRWKQEDESSANM